MDKQARIIVGDVEMRYNHSRRFPFDPDMVRLEIALVSNYKRELESRGYSVEVEVYDNLDSHVSGLDLGETLSLYDSQVDWDYTDAEVSRIITEHVQ